MKVVANLSKIVTRSQFRSIVVEKEKTNAKSPFHKDHIYVKLLLARLARNHWRMTKRKQEYKGVSRNKMREVYKNYVGHPFFKLIEKIYGVPLSITNSGRIELINFEFV